MRALLVSLFAAVALVQWAVPASMIWQHSNALRHGRVYRFATRPVDPYDAFRGRYVALGFAIEEVPRAMAPWAASDEAVYVRVVEDERQFAKIAEVSRERLRGDGVFRARVTYAYSDPIRLQFPFDRFYMEETAAPKAETAYAEHSRREQQDAYVAVRIKDGVAAIEELYVDGKPIREFLVGK